MDRELLDLKRRSLQDPWTRYRFRVQCVRAGQPELAGLEAGDLVLVDEVESPWVSSPWRGEVVRVFEAGDKYVRPLEHAIPYRVRPSPEYLRKGLYLTREDKATLLAPALPGGAVVEQRTAA